MSGLPDEGVAPDWAGEGKIIKSEQLDELHFNLEKGLLKLLESLLKKQKVGNWEVSFV